MSKQVRGGHHLRALIVIPGTVNYFYNQSGRRLGEALEALGCAVDLCTLSECPSQDYDWCILSNITEVLFADGNADAAETKIRALRQRCRGMASCAIDCVRTPWYERIWQACDRCGVDLILDLALHDQRDYLPPDRRENYRFVFSGLTPREEQTLKRLAASEGPRVFPWAFVGHKTSYRVALIDHLIQTVHPGGFIYMPAPAPYTEQGSPHLNQEKFEAILRKTRYQIWCSHHHHFYMEPERFRTSLLTGSLPVKILDSRRDVPPGVPFTYLMMEAGDVGERLRTGNFAQVRERFWRDWEDAPRLAEELSRVLRLPAANAQPRLARAA
jgi:hypothetical protein